MKQFGWFESALGHYCGHNGSRLSNLEDHPQLVPKLFNLESPQQVPKVVQVLTHTLFNRTMLVKTSGECQKYHSLW